MSEHLYAKKSLGQHFLKSKAAIRAMIKAPSVTADDTVVEIGPGKGVLTRALLEAGATVIAFELDERMIAFLHQEFATYIDTEQLQIVHQDIVTVNIQQYVGNRPYKIIANIPYYITNLIMRTFLETEHQPTDMCLLIQKEVAERIVARDGKQSLLSLSVQAFGTAQYIMKVGRNYFSPPPKVDSAIVHIYGISHKYFDGPDDERGFFQLLHHAFAHKRKQLMSNLRSHYPEDSIKSVLLENDLPITVRAEDVSFEVWLKIYKAIA
jgi:16S rRNA (adenine1518-N6/adenine1519-N6)-dimethyltransferase